MNREASTGRVSRKRLSTKSWPIGLVHLQGRQPFPGAHRKTHRDAGFHPNGAQRILRRNPSVFSIVRVSTDGKQRVLALTNVSADSPRGLVLRDGDRSARRGLEGHSYRTHVELLVGWRTSHLGALPEPLARAGLTSGEPIRQSASVRTSRSGRASPDGASLLR